MPSQVTALRVKSANTLELVSRSSAIVI